MYFLIVVVSTSVSLASASNCLTSSAQIRHYPVYCSIMEVVEHQLLLEDCMIKQIVGSCLIQHDQTRHLFLLECFYPLVMELSHCSVGRQVVRESAMMILCQRSCFLKWSMIWRYTAYSTILPTWTRWLTGDNSPQHPSSSFYGPKKSSLEAHQDYEKQM